MSQESKVPARTGAVIALAAGALTLAAGVTVGSLLGWVGPARTAPAEPPAEAGSSNPAPSAPTPSIGDDETTFAARERPRREHREHHEGKRRHHHQEREHDD